MRTNATRDALLSKLCATLCACVSSTYLLNVFGIGYSMHDMVMALAHAGMAACYALAARPADPGGTRC